MRRPMFGFELKSLGNILVDDPDESQDVRLMIARKLCLTNNRW